MCRVRLTTDIYTHTHTQTERKRKMYIVMLQYDARNYKTMIINAYTYIPRIVSRSR